MNSLEKANKVCLKKHNYYCSRLQVLNSQIANSENDLSSSELFSDTIRDVEKETSGFNSIELRLLSFIGTSTSKEINDKIRLLKQERSILVKEIINGNK